MIKQRKWIKHLKEKFTINFYGIGIGWISKNSLPYLPFDESFFSLT